MRRADLLSKKLSLIHSQITCCSWTVHMSKDSLRDSARFYAWMIVHNIWTVRLIPQWLLLRKFQKTSPGVWSVRLFWTRSSSVWNSAVSSPAEACAEMSGSQRGREHAEMQQALQSLVLWVSTHAEAWHRGNGYLWEYFRRQDHLALYLQTSRSPLATFHVNVGRLFSVQMTAVTKLSCRWTLLDSTLSSSYPRHLWCISFWE